MTRTRAVCESCATHPATVAVTFADGAVYRVCDGCAPAAEAVA